MKGVLIQNQFEYRLEVPGEDFCQGDTLNAVLSVKNHAASARQVPALRLDLVLADLKKMKDKKGDAFEMISKGNCESLGELLPQASKSAALTFVLNKNCPISDKGQSLCFLFGDAVDPGGCGQSPVTIQPHRYIQKMLTIFDSPFQFVLKGQKGGKGCVEAKMKPPAARRFVLVDELVLGSRFDGDVLELTYTFKVKGFDASANSMNVKKGKAEVKQRLEPDVYLLTPEHLNHEKIEAKIEEALATVASNI